MGRSTVVFRFKHILAATALLTLCTALFAGSSDDAGAHFKAIAAGNVEQIMHGYADNTALQWVRGSLNGAYSISRSKVIRS